MMPPEAVAPTSLNLRPELQALLTSATGRQHLSTELLSALDWEALICKAVDHGLVPQLYRALSEVPAGSVPVPALRALEGHQRDVVQRGLRLTATLLEVHQALTTAGLKAIPYKGPTLAMQLYGDPALRDAVDLDILLPQQQVMPALEVMARVGFVPAREYRPEIREQLLRYRAEIGLVKDDQLVELQWRLAPNYFSVEMDFEQLWHRRREVQIKDRSLPVLSAEDNLLVLSVHGAKHHWNTLKWLLDVDRLLQTNPSLDWRVTLERAETLGVQRIVETTLHACAKLLETPLPAQVGTALLEDPKVAEVVDEVVKGIATGTRWSDEQHHRFQLTLRERRRDRLRYLSRLAWQPTESEWDAINLPRGLAWLYPVVRFGRVAAKSVA